MYARVGRHGQILPFEGDIAIVAHHMRGIEVDAEHQVGGVAQLTLGPRNGRGDSVGRGLVLAACRQTRHRDKLFNAQLARKFCTIVHGFL